MKSPNPKHGTVRECETCERQLPSYDPRELWTKGWRVVDGGWYCAVCVSAANAELRESK